MDNNNGIPHQDRETHCRNSLTVTDYTTILQNMGPYLTAGPAARRGGPATADAAHTAHRAGLATIATCLGAAADVSLSLPFVFPIMSFCLSRCLVCCISRAGGWPPSRSPTPRHEEGDVAVAGSLEEEGEDRKSGGRGEANCIYG
eukprot:g28570.t1